MSSGSLVVGVGTQNESTPPKNSTPHDAHAHCTAILVRLRPDTSRCDSVGIGEADVQRTGIELHSGLSLIVRAEFFNLLSKVADASLDLTSENFHLSG